MSTEQTLTPWVYRKHGGYYLVTHENGRIRLGSDYCEAMRAWAELVKRHSV